LEFQSDQPVQGNEFRLHSSLDVGRESVEASAAAARGIIQRLLEYFHVSA